MKKIIISIIFLIIFLIILVYGLLFTQPGNNILKPVIEKKLTLNLKLPVSITEFSLRPSHITLNFKSPNALKTSLNSKFSIFGKDIDGKAVIQIFDFSKFSNFTNLKLSGKCLVDIAFKGNLKKRLNIAISSNIFNGDTKAKIVLINERLKEIAYNIKDIPIENILSFFNYKKYAKGNLDSYGKFDLINLKGNGKTLFIGNFVPSLIKKDFQINLPYTKFKGEILKQLKGDNLNIVANIYSTLANIFIDKTAYNIKSNTLKSHYKAVIDNLAILNNIINQKLIGKGEIDGNLKFDKKLYTKGTLVLNKNKINYNIVYPHLVATSKNFDSIDILKTLSYPPIFETFANINLNYNLLTQKGKLNLTFDKGIFKNTKLFKMIKVFTGVDITLEVYRNGFLNTDIDKKILKNIFELKSKKTKIYSKKTTIDLNKSIIDSIINFEILGLPIKIFLTGDLKKPDVKTNIKDMIKKQIFPQKNIKEIKKNVEKNIKGIINNFIKNVR